jgi:polyhydroxybutyrate depolymerase
MSSGCGASTLMPGDSMNMIMTKDGMTRSYLLHVPASYDGSMPVPFLLDIHGWTSNAMQQQGLSGWKAKSDTEGFIAAWPDGVGNSWNGGSLCCGTAQSSGIDDEGFMRQLVDKIEGQACIDTKRVYATGLSNGGAMSHLLACKAADVFAATAPVSMGNGTIPCAPSRPISVIMFRDMSDPLVSYTGGLFPSAMADFDQWKMLAGCDGTAEMTQNGHCQLYTGCGAGTEVELCTTTSAGHVLYPNSDGVMVPDVAWESFSRQALP